MIKPHDHIRLFSPWIILFLFECLLFGAPGVVINEINYNPSNNTLRAEFIELFNAGDSAVEIGNWSFTDGIEYTFEPGTQLEAGGYVIVCEDPATILREFGVDALGPWDGNLRSEGERVCLEDDSGMIVDEVRYGVGFPWPVASFGEGSSMELVHSSMDNSRGSSWRAGSPDTLPPAEYHPFISAGDGCHAIVPSNGRFDNNWMDLDADVSEWREGVTGVGFERSPADYQDLIKIDFKAEMDYGDTSLYVRIPFNISKLPDLNRLVLRMKYDDGFIAYLNGTRVASVNAPDSPAWDSEATGQHPDAQAVVFEIFDISEHIGLLREGKNVLSVHGLNDSPGSSDALVLPELEGIFEPAPLLGQATPGARNRFFAENPPPSIENLRSTPFQPKSFEDTAIEISISDGDGISGVQLEYQVVRPGHYIPSHLPVPLTQLQQSPETEPGPNPQYSAAVNWEVLEMRDDGGGGDRVSGNGIFTAVIPGQDHRTLIRYRIRAVDSLGATAQAPFADDPSLNFAYFVYDGIPDYEGYGKEIMASLPVYTLIARAEDVSEVVAYNSADQIPQFLNGRSNEARYSFNWTGTLVYDGVVYDNIRFRLRGANGRYQLAGKRNWRFKFNKGHYLRAKDQKGNPFPTEWKALNTGKGMSNRLTLTYSLNEAVNNFLFNTIGVPAPEAFFFHFRVIDGPEEQPDAYSGDFWGLSWAQENYDSNFLEGHNLPKGNLYKLINSKRDAAGQQRYQASYAVAEGADHDNIENNATGYRPLDWLRAHIHYEEWYLYRALSEAIRHYDYWPDANKNAAWYFEPVYTPENGFLGRMWTFPWDTDSTWGPTWNEGHDVVYNTIFRSGAGGGDAGEHPELQLEYRNVLRELRDLLWQEDQVYSVIDFLASPIEGFTLADRKRWYLAPAQYGNYNGVTGPGLTSFSAFVRDMKNFAFKGGSWPGGNVQTGGQAAVVDRYAADALIPETPTITYLGEPGYPISGLWFRSSPFSDPQGTGTFGAMEYRIAEIEPETYQPVSAGRPPILEWNAIWESGVIDTFQQEIIFPANTLMPGHKYRVRVRHMDESGRWSHWSKPVEFIPGAPDLAVYRNNLIISEIMYHPSGATPDEAAAGFMESDFEFIELLNIGSVSLDLRPLHFTDGIGFVFLDSNIATIGPGQRMVLASNAAAFRMRYGFGATILGEFGLGPEGMNLSNGGERLKITYGAADVILDVTYSDEPPWPTGADGSGYSLVLRNPWSGTSVSSPVRWRVSSRLQGNPGGHDHQVYQQWAFEQGGVGEPYEDDDGDGYLNIVEYALGTDACDAGDFPVPQLSLQYLEMDGLLHRYFTISLKRPVNFDDCDLAVYPADTPDGFGTRTRPLPLARPSILHGDGTETLMWRDVLPMDQIGKDMRFYRYHVIWDDWTM